VRRLVLFDIDSTLIDAGGAGGRALLPAITDVYGVTGRLDGYTFHGRTDPQIVREVAVMWGVPPADVDARLQECLDRYVARLKVGIGAARVRVLPGVADLVPALSGDPAAAVGLLTGNVEEGARLKLDRVGLLDQFELGAYGSDAERRRELPAVAVERARRLLDHRFVGKDVVIVGDTPADVLCGADLGVTAVGVATGSHTREELEAAGADHVFCDLSDWRSIRAVVAPTDMAWAGGERAPMSGLQDGRRASP